MQTVLVTGSEGFIGRNLCERLESEPDTEILRFTRASSKSDLEDYVRRTDFIFHLAGVMRPQDTREFDDINTGLTKTILAQLTNNHNDAPLLVTSSIQATQDNPYGRSKAAAEEAVRSWATQSNRAVYIYRLPNVFGKWSRPNYSSVVATFCYNISHGLPIEIHDPSREMCLAYIDDVVDAFMADVRGETRTATDDFRTIDRTFNITLQALADTLQRFQTERKAKDTTPILHNTFERFLYSTYTSFEQLA